MIKSEPLLQAGMYGERLAMYGAEADHVIELWVSGLLSVGYDWALSFHFR